jgi:glycosyltransferase involved in cell wall biosynthesis
MKHDVPVALLTSGDEGIREYLEKRGLENVLFHAADGWGLRSVAAIAKKIRESGGSHVFMEYPGKGYRRSVFAVLLPLFIKHAARSVRVVVRLHEYSNVRLLSKLVIVPLVSFADFVIIPSEDDLALARRSMPWIRKKSKAIMIGSNVPRRDFAPAELAGFRKSLTENDSDRIATYFGFIYKNKGFEVLTDVMCSLIRKRKDLVWLVLGDFLSPRDRDAWLRDVESRGVGSRVRYLGYVPNVDVSRYLSVTDVCVLPYADGVSLRRGSFMAAVGHGLPIVTVRNDRLNHLLKDGENILLCDSLDRHQLEEKTNRLLEDPGLRESVGRKVLDLDFSWESIWLEIKEVLFDQ